MGCYNCERHDKVERVCESRRMEAFLSRSLETELTLERIEHAGTPDFAVFDRTNPVLLELSEEGSPNFLARRGYDASLRDLSLEDQNRPECDGLHRGIAGREGERLISFKGRWFRFDNPGNKCAPFQP